MLSQLSEERSGRKLNGTNVIHLLLTDQATGMNYLRSHFIELCISHFDLTLFVYKTSLLLTTDLECWMKLTQSGIDHLLPFLPSWCLGFGINYIFAISSETLFIEGNGRSCFGTEIKAL